MFVALLRKITLVLHKETPKIIPVIQKMLKNTSDETCSQYKNSGDIEKMFKLNV